MDTSNEFMKERKQAYQNILKKWIKPNSCKKVFFFCTPIICLMSFIDKKVGNLKTTPTFITSALKVEH